MQTILRTQFQGQSKLYVGGRSFQNGVPAKPQRLIRSRAAFGPMMTFPDFDRIDSEFDQSFQQMNQQMIRMQRQLDQDIEQTLKQSDAEVSRAIQQGRAQIYTRESSRPNFYHYERVTLVGATPQVAVIQPAASPLVPPIVGYILIGAFAAVTVRFVRNFHLTKFKKGSTIKLTLLWPILLIFSKEFRQEFQKALTGAPEKDS